MNIGNMSKKADDVAAFKNRRLGILIRV